MTDPVGAVGYVDPTNVPTNVPVVSQNDTSSLLDPQAFLQLLVAQLQYQDPNSPADMSSFMNQTATLSQVQTMNSMQTTLTSLMRTEQAQTATTMIGKSITYMDATGTAQTGVVTGATQLTSDPQVLIGSQSVPLTSVTGVSAPPAST